MTPADSPALEADVSFERFDALQEFSKKIGELEAEAGVSPGYCFPDKNIDRLDLDTIRRGVVDRIDADPQVPGHRPDRGQLFPRGELPRNDLVFDVLVKAPDTGEDRFVLTACRPLYP